MDKKYPTDEEWERDYIEPYDEGEAYAQEKAQLEDPEYLKRLINAEVKEIRKNAWGSLRSSYRRGVSPERDDYDFNMAFLPYVEEIVEVLEAEPGLRRNNVEAVVVAKRNGGTKDILSYRSWSTPGSFYEPPDGETWVEWHALPHTREDDRIGATCPCQDCNYLRTGEYGRKQ